jgi:hypothetical protein
MGQMVKGSMVYVLSNVDEYARVSEDSIRACYVLLVYMWYRLVTV